MKEKRWFRVLVLVSAAFLVILAVLGPELLSRYRDRFFLNRITLEE